MQVYKVEIRGKIMACKVLMADSATLPEYTPTEFDAEMKILMQMSSPYVVNFLGACLAASPKKFMTEYCEGGDLCRALRKDSHRHLSWYNR